MEPKVNERLPIKVKLLGTNGNAFAVLGEMRKAFTKAGYKDKWNAFLEEASAGDYNHLLATCMKWVTVR